MRRQRVMWMLLGVLLVSCCHPRSAAAQTPRSWEVSAGYSFMRDPASDVNFPVGWVVGVAGKLTDWFSAVGEIGGHHKTISAIGSDLSLSVHTFMVGARASTKFADLTEFGQVLVGFVHGSGTLFGSTSSGTNVGLQPGAGLDYALNLKLAARGEIDYRVISSGGSGGDTGREFRFVAGIVYTFP